MTRMDDLVDGLNVVGVGNVQFRRGHYNLIKLEQEKRPDDVRVSLC